MAYRILTINPGSTSTKIAVYENLEELYKDSIPHDAQTLQKFDHIMDQLQYRKELVLESLENHHISLESLSAIVARGGLLPPIKAGAYEVNEDMVWQLKYKPDHEHASNLAAVIGYEIAREVHCPCYIYDGVTVDEMDPVMKLTGLPHMERKGMGHNLNMRAMAIRYANEQHKNYKDVTVIVAHLGGGISVSLHHEGRIADIMSDEMGPFSPERSGALPVHQLIKWIMSHHYSQEELMKIVKTKSGLMAYCGTTDIRDIELLIDKGNEKAKLVYDAMALNVAKCICSEAAIVNGRIEGIVLTGGMAYSKRFTDAIQERINFLAPVHIYAGENEMLALAKGGLRVLQGQEKAQVFHKQV